jgi:hypothetical protein
MSVALLDSEFLAAIGRNETESVADYGGLAIDVPRIVANFALF